FFFQAEDGIRDFHVTGVQTCALPISTKILEGSKKQVKDQFRSNTYIVEHRGVFNVRDDRFEITERKTLDENFYRSILKTNGDAKIGRASCRESEKNMSEP